MAGCVSDPEGAGLSETPGWSRLQGVAEPAAHHCLVEAPSVGAAEAARRLQYVLGRGEPGSRELRCHYTVLGRSPGVERLGHGSELLPQPAGHRGRHRESPCNDLRIAGQEPNCPGGRAQRADHARRVEAGFVEPRVGGFRQLARYLDAERVRGQRLAATRAGQLGERQDGRQHRCRRVGEQAIDPVWPLGELGIVVERVGSGSVGQRCLLGRCPDCRADHRG